MSRYNATDPALFPTRSVSTAIERGDRGDDRGPQVGRGEGGRLRHPVSSGRRRAARRAPRRSPAPVARRGSRRVGRSCRWLPCSTSRGTVGVSSSGSRDFSGRPGRCSGKARQTTPATSNSGRGPAGDPGAGAAAAEEQRPAGRGIDPAGQTAARQPTSRRGGGTATLRPAVRHGCSKRTTVMPAAGSRRASRSRSVAVTPPPAPCPSISVARAGVPTGTASTNSRPGPSGVVISTIWVSI